MNRDDILNKEAGPEMNALVAEYVMGQTDFDHPGFFWNEGTTEDGKDGWDGFNCPRCGAPKGDTGKCVKHYSTDISAAWEVIEKLKQLGFLIIRLATGDILGNFWQFQCADKWREISRDGDKDYFANAPTAPLAICQAALLAMLEDV